MNENLLLVAGGVLAYLMGSFSSAVWIGKWFYNTDVREHGSGNAGATNTIRVLGTRAGVIVMVLDIVKAWGAVMLAHRVVHRPQDVELELQQFQRAFLFGPGAEQVEREPQTVLHVAMRFLHAALEVVEPVGLDPRIVLRPFGDALLMDRRREQLGQR